MNVYTLLILLRLSYVQTCEIKEWNPFSGEVHLAALILARGGSKSIPLKNISLVGNKTLLERSLQAIKRTERFSSIWVSTDHQSIAQVAFRNNVNVHINSDENVRDTSTSIAAVQHFLQYHTEVDVLGLVQCTSPFITANYLLQAIDAIKTDRNECVFSVTRSTKLRWKKIGRSIIALNFNPKFRPRRQNITDEYVENGMFYFASRRLLKKGYFQSRRYILNLYIYATNLSNLSNNATTNGICTDAEELAYPANHTQSVA